jgi:hypothetical protein
LKETSLLLEIGVKSVLFEQSPSKNLQHFFTFLKSKILSFFGRKCFQRWAQGKKFVEKILFLQKMLIIYENKGSYHWFSRKTPNSSPKKIWRKLSKMVENRRKWSKLAENFAKIVILTLTPAGLTSHASSRDAS